jgi:RNase P/RNase MRP subunit POP5
LLKRIRRRYLALEIDSGELFDSREFLDAVWSAVLKLYGEHGASRAGLTLIDYDMEKRFAVIRTVHTAVDMVRTALASMTRIGNKPVAINILRVSGTIRSLYTKTKK